MPDQGVNRQNHNLRWIWANIVLLLGIGTSSKLQLEVDLALYQTREHYNKIATWGRTGTIPVQGMFCLICNLKWIWHYTSQGIHRQIWNLLLEVALPLYRPWAYIVRLAAIGGSDTIPTDSKHCQMYNLRWIWYYTGQGNILPYFLHQGWSVTILDQDICGLF